MTYFLDFDRTLFDTDALIAYMHEREDTKDIYLLTNDNAIKQELAHRTETGILAFARGELAKFLYADAASFLKTHEVVVITSGFASFQRLKVENVLPADEQEVRYTDNLLKGEYLRKNFGPEVEGVFADDRPTELESVQALCPRMSVYEMRRDGKEGDGRYPVVRSLSELEALVVK